MNGVGKGQSDMRAVMKRRVVLGEGERCTDSSGERNTVYGPRSRVDDRVVAAVAEAAHGAHLGGLPRTALAA